MTLTKGEQMRQYNARVAQVQVGMSVSAVTDLLGQPSAIVGREQMATPTEVFNSLGLSFSFGDERVEEIRVYVDPNRPRVRHCLGCAGGVVLSAWKEVLTAERLAELAGQAPGRG